MTDYPPIGNLEYQTAFGAIEESFGKDMDIPQFQQAETEIHENYFLKKNIMIPGLNHPLNILFTLNAYFEYTQSFEGNITRITTYYQKVDAFVPCVELSYVLDISIPMGIQMGPRCYGVKLSDCSIFTRAFHASHKGKKKKRFESFMKFIEAEAKRESLFTESIRKISNWGSLSLTNTVGWFWSRKIEFSFVLRLVPFWGKTIVQVRFIPYTMKSGFESKHDESRFITVEGMNRAVYIWTCNRERVKEVISILKHANKIAEQFDIGGTQAVDVLSMGGLLQYEIMKMAQEQYSPDSSPLTLRDMILQTEPITHLRNRLNKDVCKGKWGRMEPKLGIFEVSVT